MCGWWSKKGKIRKRIRRGREIEGKRREKRESKKEGEDDVRSRKVKE